MKKEWFFFPLGILFKKLGGIPVYRQKHTSMTDSMAETAKAAREFHLCITPEGTRSPNPDWKKGFYYIAKGANIPILLAGIDFATKTITIGKEITPSGDFEKDMREIKLYFKDFKGKHPENFSIGDVE
jgi:1-acyl-sn-glycerol-3-phosphate acyltransferase